MNDIEKDAARYRWLLNHGTGWTWNGPNESFRSFNIRPGVMTAWIDQQMEAGVMTRETMRLRDWLKLAAFGMFGTALVFGLCWTLPLIYYVIYGENP